MTRSLLIGLAIRRLRSSRWCCRDYARKPWPGWKRSLYSSNCVHTALQILQVGLSNRRVPQFLPVYSAWRVRLWLLLLQECSQHKHCTISLCWAVVIHTAPPVVCHVRNCPKRVAATSCLTVDVLFFRDVVNCVYRAPRGASSFDRAAPSALIV